MQNADSLPDRLKGQVSWAVTVGKLAILKAIASELFPGKLEVDILEDPEIPDENYVLFRVMLPSNATDASGLRQKWYRRTTNVLQDECGKVRLQISVG